MIKLKKIITRDNENLVYANDASVFKFINPNDNDKLSEMSGLDLQDLIILIDEYYLQLRDQLGFDESITFGLELEFENAMKDRIDRQLRKVFPDDEWITVHDASLRKGAEINSPILRDTKANWENLNKVCSIVKPLASIDTKSGGHIHVGTQVLGSNKDSWLNFIKMWSVYENIIFRFVYGDFLTARPSMQKYAEPMAKDFWRDYVELSAKHASLEAVVREISHKRYQAVNFNNVRLSSCDNFRTNNTIEFRCPNGSLNAAIWQNNVNLFVRMLCYSNDASFNDDLVEKRHRFNLDKFAELKFYDEIYLEQALELCDMLFPSNLDKVYFLRQYLKSFQICKIGMDYPKAYALTKK